MSIPNSCTSIGNFPITWIPSEWNRTSCFFAILAISCNGSTVPTSLLASIMVMSPVSSLIAASISSGFTQPYLLTGIMVCVIPRCSNCRNTARMAGCSIALVMTCFRSLWIMFHRTRLFASLPPPVKMISLGAQFTASAICFLAVSTTCFAFLPATWILEGFP